MDPKNPLSVLRHDMNNHLNNMRLCMRVLETETDPNEAIEWVDSIERAADECIASLDRYDREVPD
jgi:predicted transcriptional regulator